MSVRVALGLAYIRCEDRICVTRVGYDVGVKDRTHIFGLLFMEFVKRRLRPCGL
jgi:hypothetical protein